MSAKLIHREVSTNADGCRHVTHVYSNGSVWQIRADLALGTFASRITRGYVMRWFPAPAFITLFGEPDNWQH